MTLTVEHRFPCRRVGLDTHHHFFGYYNKSPWDLSDRYLAAQRVPMMTADITPHSKAEVGYFDLEADERFHVVGETQAWNWQMGSQLQWLDNGGASLIYNTRVQGARSPYAGLGATIVDVKSGARRELPMPIYVAAPNGAFALCIDYERLQVTHRTIGYPPALLPSPLALAPATDGIHWMDLGTGEARLVMSYADLRAFHPKPSMEKAIHWVSHIEIGPASSRVLLLHRWTERVEDETCFLHRLITMNPDGTDLRLLECSDHPLPQLSTTFDPTAVGTFDYEKSEYQISHPMWVDESRIIVWSPHAGRIRYHLYVDARPANVAVVGEGVLTENGHMSFAPHDKRWLLSDTYPDATSHIRQLIMYDMKEARCHSLGDFFATPTLGKENRCDLHPRWRRDGKQVCIDSVHEGQRQMYIVDVSSLVGGPR